MIVQYVFLRSDLKSFGRGSLVAQACHASVKAIHTFYTHKDVQEYMKSDNMTTVVLKIIENDLQTLYSDLLCLDYVKWTEQLENIVTCVAMRPYNTSDISEKLVNIRNYKLF